MLPALTKLFSWMMVIKRFHWYLPAHTRKEFYTYSKNLLIHYLQLVSISTLYQRCIELILIAKTFDQN